MAGMSRRGLRITSWTMVALVCALIGALLFVSTQIKTRWDWTANGRNSLTAPSAALLKTLKGPVQVTAFLGPDASDRARIARLVSRYTRVKPDLTVRFVDPNRHPELARKDGIVTAGALLVSYGGRTQVVADASEQALTNALAGLGRQGLMTLAFVTGHGESSPTDGSEIGLSALARELEARGLHVVTTTLARKQALDPATTTLVIAGPQARYLPGEVASLVSFVRKGGNLLWFQSLGPLNGLRPLAHELGITVLPGIAVDPQSQLLTERADFVAILHYGQNPVVSDLRTLTVLPLSRGLKIDKSAGGLPFTADPLLVTDEGAWESAHPHAGNLRFHPATDQPGPLVLGVTLERTVAHHSQRVAVIGNANFAANGYLNTGGNLAFAMNLANWVTHADRYVNLPVARAPDQTLALTERSALALVMSLLIGVPLVLIGVAVTVFWRRRRAARA